MGTRADFYIGRGDKAAWIGSIAWDGYPDGLKDTGILKADTETRFVDTVKKFAAKRDDWTKPQDGWPWPWDDSRTTDYAYAFDGKKVWGSCFGREWFDASKPEPEEDSPKTATFPNMKDKQKVTLGKRSGLIVTTPKGIVS